MKIISSLVLCYFCITLFSFGEEKVVGHPIPKDSKVEHDFRVKSKYFLMDIYTDKKLSECETYEELRDTLKLVIPEILKTRY